MCNPLVKEVIERTGLKTPSKLGGAIGASRQLANSWIKGKSKPDGEHTLRLAILAGLSAEDALNLVTRPTLEGTQNQGRVSNPMYIMLNQVSKLKVLWIGSLDSITASLRPLAGFRPCRY